MNELQQKMISMATARYHTIYPCKSRTTLADCFTVEENQLFFWFNTDDQSTHMLAQEM